MYLFSIGVQPKVPSSIKWSETPAHEFYAKIYDSSYAAGGQLTPNPWGYLGA